MKTIHRLEIVVAESDYDCATGLLALEVPFGWEEQSLPTGETRFRVHCEQKDFLERLQQLAEADRPGCGKRSFRAGGDRLAGGLASVLHACVLR